MKRARRTRILVRGQSALRGRLAREIEDSYAVHEIDAPNEGLVMLKMRDSARHTLYYLGEVLVTESKVRIGEKIGLGIVAGNAPDIARELAIIDAAVAANLPETAHWEAVLAEEERLIRERDLREQSQVGETRVSFETMDAP